METAEAVVQLLGVDSKLGILTGLALVAKKQQELQSEDEDAAASGGSSPSDKREGGGAVVAGGNARKTQRKRHGSTANSDGASGDNGGGSSGSTAPGSKKYSVHEQRDVIRKLQEQNQVLKQELAIESRDARIMLSHEKRQQFERLQKMAATFAKKIELVKKNTARADELLAKKTQELELIRQQQHSESTSGSNNSSTSGSGSLTVGSASESSGGGALAVAVESTAASTRRVRALENRLELSLVKKNEMDSINKHLRAQIEKVRRDRVIFDGIYKKLEKELSEYRQRHELSVEELKRAMDAKHQVNLEIESIQSQAEQEQRAYEQQFQELKASIETSMREAARLGGGGTIGPASPFTSKGGNSNTLGHSDVDELGSGLSMTGGFDMPAKDSPLNRISVLSTWKIGYDRALASTNEGVTAKYEKAFAGIKQLTGIQDIAKIAEEIVNRDENNFKRFKRVEELHQEEVALHQQIDELTTQGEAFKAQEGIATSATQKQQFKELDVKYQKALDKARTFDNEFDDTVTALTRIKSSVHSIHSMLAHANCARNVDKFSHGSAHLALGSHSARDVTDTNVLEYLQAIETFATSLMKETHEAAQATATTGDSAGAGTVTGLAEDASLGPGSSGSSQLGLSLGSHISASTASQHQQHYQDELAASSPIGHGPPTLPSDPSQKLRVHVPSPGGVNGVIVIPANSPFNSDEPASDPHHLLPHGRQPPTTTLHHSPAKTLQQQLHMHQGLQRRKSGGRFELMARKSLSQMQFAAALAAAVTAANNGQMPPSSHFPAHLLGEPGSITGGDAGGTSGTGGRGRGGSTQDSAAMPGSPESSQQLSRARLDEEEEERALTYEELRQYAAKNVVKKKSDDASLAQPASRASSSSGCGSSSNSSSVSPSKAAAQHHQHQPHHHS